MMTVTDPYHDPTQPQGPIPLPPQGPYPPQAAAYGQPISPAPYQQQPTSAPPFGQPQPQIVVVQATAPPTSTSATIGLIFGILGLVVGCCSFGVFSVVAIICGHMALRETNNNAMAGRGMAVASLVMGYLGVVPAIFISATWFIGAVTGNHTTATP